MGAKPRRFSFLEMESHEVAALELGQCLSFSTRLDELYDGRVDIRKG